MLTVDQILRVARFQEQNSRIPPDEFSPASLSSPEKPKWRLEHKKITLPNGKEDIVLCQVSN